MGNTASINTADCESDEQCVDGFWGSEGKCVEGNCECDSGYSGTDLWHTANDCHVSLGFIQVYFLIHAVINVICMCVSLIFLWRWYGMASGSKGPKGLFHPKNRWRSFLYLFCSLYCLGCAVTGFCIAIVGARHKDPPWALVWVLYIGMGALCHKSVMASWLSSLPYSLLPPNHWARSLIKQKEKLMHVLFATDICCVTGLAIFSLFATSPMLFELWRQLFFWWVIVSCIFPPMLIVPSIATSLLKFLKGKEQFKEQAKKAMIARALGFGIAFEALVGCLCLMYIRWFWQFPHFWWPTLEFAGDLFFMLMLILFKPKKVIRHVGQTSVATSHMPRSLKASLFGSKEMNLKASILGMGQRK